MKRLTISGLMDEYTDTEFFPTGGSVADPEAVKGLVLASVKAPAPVKKGRMPKRKKILLAAALAAVLVVLVGAGSSTFVQGLLTGRVEYEITPDKQTVSVIHDKPPVRQEDGRIWFVANGQRIDITDLIDEETPFIYDGCDPDTKLVDYLIVGGVPGNVGWYEYFRAPNVPYCGGSDNALVAYYESADGVRYLKNELTQEQWEEISSDTGEWEVVYVERPWVAAAEAELNLKFGLT